MRQNPINPPLLIIEAALERHSPRCAALTLATLAWALAPSVAAAAEPAGSPAGEIEPLVVTAQKREEDLQQVPLSVSVVSDAALSDFEFSQATDLQYVTPGLAAPTQAGPRNFGFFIRGVGTTTFSSETIEPSIAFVVDGVTVGQGGASLTDLPDVERIEILRGPQGTLFGKNASAGVINIVTTRPSADLRASVSATYQAPNDHRRLAASVSGPISDVLRFSLSGRWLRRGGYIHNVFDGRKLNDEDQSGVRGKLEWAPSPSTRVTLTSDFWRRDAGCCIWSWERFGARGGAPSASETLSLKAGVVPGIDNLKQNVDGDVFADSKSYGGALQIEHELGGGFRLTAITGVRTFETRDGLDSDSLPLDILNTNYADHTQRQVSQEVRLASPTGGFVDYVTGLYYFETRVRSFTRQYFPTVPLPFFDRSVSVSAMTANYAAFGQANMHVSQDLSLILGVRLLEEIQQVEKQRTDVRLTLADSASARKTDRAVTWRAGLQYDLSDDAMAFASVTRGYKGGGFDSNIAVQALRDIGPERPTSIEAGVRTTWPMQRLTLNGTAFHTHIRGYQTASRDAATLTFPISNGDAQTWGFEVQAAWRPWRDVDFATAAEVAYTQAKWGTFKAAPCYAGQTAALGCMAGAQDLTGQPLPFAPRWAYNLNATYVRPVGGQYKARGSALLSYRSKQYIGFPNSPDALEPGYVLVNASLAIGPTDDQWEMRLFGKNLTNQHFRSYSFNSGAGSAGMYRVYESQRTVGVEAILNF